MRIWPAKRLAASIPLVLCGSLVACADSSAEEARWADEQMVMASSQTSALIPDLEKVLNRQRPYNYTDLESVLLSASQLPDVSMRAATHAERATLAGVGDLAGQISSVHNDALDLVVKGMNPSYWQGDVVEDAASVWSASTRMVEVCGEMESNYRKKYDGE